MNNNVNAVAIVVYVVVALFLGELIGSDAAVWAVALISVAFVVVYVVLGRGRLLPPLGWVALSTIVIPLAFLSFVGIPAYGSLNGFLRGLLSVPGLVGPAFVEMFMPLAAGTLTVAVLKVMRSNTYEAPARQEVKKGLRKG